MSLNTRHLRPLRLSRRPVRHATDTGASSAVMRALEAADVGTWLLDLSSGSLTVTPAHQALLGFAPGTFDRSVHSLLARVPESERDALREAIARVYAGHDEYAHEFHVRWPDGSLHRVSTWGRAVRDPITGRPHAIGGIVMDPTRHGGGLLLPMPRAGGQLPPPGERTSSSEDLLRNLSHELRTPLTAILGWSWLLRAHSGDPAAVKHAADVIERNARAEAQIVDDLLDASTIVAGRMKIERRTVSMREVVNSAVRSMTTRASLAHVTLETSFDDGDDRVCGARDRLERIVWHLLSNAVKFSSREGVVRVAVRSLDGHVEVRVSDQGHGIDPAMLPKLFAQARQGDPSNTRAHGGLGLGLAITRHLVDLHGGTVRAESAGVGHGASFVVTLPLGCADLRHSLPGGRASLAPA